LNQNFNQDHYRKKRENWNNRYQKQGTDFRWITTELPPELKQSLALITDKEGTVLDLGSGPGILTKILANSFSFVVGTDFSIEAIRIASESPCAAHFIVSDANLPPFKDASFDFILDRQCLSSLHYKDWPKYFADIEEMLNKGGIFHLFCKSLANAPPLFSRAGLKNRIRKRFIQKKRLISEKLIRKLVSPDLAILSLEETKVIFSNKQVQHLLSCVFRKK